MGRDLKYYKIINFKYNGDLGISNEVLKTIITKSIEEVDGIKLCVPHTIFSRGPIIIKYSKKYNVFIKLSVSIEYGYDLTKTCHKLQEKIEHDLMYMTEINPKKIDIKIDN